MHRGAGSGAHSYKPCYFSISIQHKFEQDLPRNKCTHIYPSTHLHKLIFKGSYLPIIGCIGLTHVFGEAPFRPAPNVRRALTARHLPTLHVLSVLSQLLKSAFVVKKCCMRFGKLHQSNGRKHADLSLVFSLSFTFPNTTQIALINVTSSGWPY